jgi:hypothetical protein
MLGQGGKAQPVAADRLANLPNANPNPNAAALKDYPTTTLLAGPVSGSEWPDSV